MKRAFQITTFLFGLFVIISLSTPSWRYGPFSWWPIWSFPHLAGGPVQLGILNLILPAFLVSWFVVQVHAGEWAWGPRWLTLPLLGFSVWALVGLLGAPFRLWFIFGGDLVLVWLTYLFYINRQPAMSIPLALVIAAQGLVGCLQFMQQGDLGLVALGELPLNPAFQGVTVLQARGAPWLRAYGLTAHPNLYGALLALSLILMMVQRQASRRRHLLLLLPVVGLGLAGLFFSFSRAAWLGTAVGFTAWFAIAQRKSDREGRSRLRWLMLPLLLLLIAIVWVYGDLVMSRFINLDAPLEAQSIGERLRDARLALQLLFRFPWTGVGLGRNIDAALLLDANADRVHNVFLLAGAELGLPGLLLVALLLLGPLLPYYRIYRSGAYSRVALGLAPWLVVLTVNQLDITLWLTGNWQTAILFALAAGNVASQYQVATVARTRPREPGEGVHSA